MRPSSTRTAAALIALVTVPSAAALLTRADGSTPTLVRATGPLHVKPLDDIPPTTTTVPPPPPTTAPRAPQVAWPKAPNPDRLSHSLDLARLRQCENGGSYQGFDGGGRFYGAYQFDSGTWASQQKKHPEIGSWGSASPEQQDAAAQYLYGERGTSPWPVCGRR